VHRINALALTTVLAVMAISPALVYAQKPGGGQSARQIGDNVAELISENLGSLLIVLIGAVGVSAFMARSIGQVVMIVIGGLFAGMFILEPSAAESLFKAVYDAIF
jgi:hypothetical protein